MKAADHALQRLLKAAARSPKAAPGAASAVFAARVLAEWRASAAEDESAFLAILFRRAVICAVLIMTLSAAWSYLETRREGAGARVFADYASTMHLPPP